MHFERLAGYWLFITMVTWVLPAVVSAQNPAPVENVSSFPPRSPEEERKAIHLPPGFEIQLVASEPAIHKPLNLSFDDRGRLWVTDTVEYPYPAAKGTKPRDSVKILSDFQRQWASRQDRDVRRRLEHPDRPAAAAGGPSGDRP